MSRQTSRIPALPFCLSWRKCLLNLLGSAILAFGLYNIHAFAGVTEGGILGATLLLQHWLGVSPAWSSLVMNALSYLIGWRILGRSFILYSAVAGGGFSLAYAVCELFPPLWSSLAQRPGIAALAGAAFVGIGIGIYGVSAIPGNKLAPVASFKCKILQVKTLKPGDGTIGYGRHGKIAPEGTVIATIPVGYADGVDRHLSCGKGHFMVNGHKVPTIGNICMDMCMLDVTGLDVKVGDRGF